MVTEFLLWYPNDFKRPIIVMIRKLRIALTNDLIGSGGPSGVNAFDRKVIAQSEGFKGQT